LATDWTIQDLNPSTGKRFFSTTTRLVLESSKPPIQWVPVALPTGKAVKT